MVIGMNFMDDVIFCIVDLILTVNPDQGHHLINTIIIATGPADPDQEAQLGNDSIILTVKPLETEALASLVILQLNLVLKYGTVQ